MSCRKPWHDPENGNVDNELAWTEHHLSTLYRAIEYHEGKLAEYRAIKAWWARFIHYCQTGE